MAQTQHTIDQLREAYRLYFNIENIINPATAEQKALSLTKTAAQIWGMIVEEIDWNWVKGEA